MLVNSNNNNNNVSKKLRDICLMTFTSWSNNSCSRHYYRDEIVRTASLYFNTFMHNVEKWPRILKKFLSF